MKQNQSSKIHKYSFYIIIIIVCAFFFFEFIEYDNTNSTEVLKVGNQYKDSNENRKKDDLDNTSSTDNLHEDVNTKVTIKEEKDDQVITDKNDKIDNSTKENVVNTNEIPTNKSEEVKLLAVGDNLIHIEVYKSGKGKDGEYNYNHLFAELKEEIKNADIAVINQETIFGNKAIGYSGYPNFCSPKEVGDAIIKAGFDVVLHANNHTMDKGVKAVEYTLNFWKKHEKVIALGINKNEEASKKIPIITKNGIRFAMLNYTYGLNGYSLPSKNSYLVNLLEEKKVKSDIIKARKQADIIIVFPHWGTEYSYKPDEDQKYWTNFFAEQGVDLVIGSHPHVLQPVEWIEAKNGHKMLVYYSLGNYVSYQREAPRMLGGMANITFIKDETGVRIKEAGITPIVTHYENKNGYQFATYKLEDYTEELAKIHGVLKVEKNSTFTLTGTKKLAKAILGDWYQIE